MGGWGWCCSGLVCYYLALYTSHLAAVRAGWGRGKAREKRKATGVGRSVSSIILSFRRFVGSQRRGPGRGGERREDYLLALAAGPFSQV